MNSPDAYFITFSTYGTRLRGDRKGWNYRDPGQPTQVRRGEVHVHVVLVAEGKPEQTMASLKAWSSERWAVASGRPL